MEDRFSRIVTWALSNRPTRRVLAVGRNDGGADQPTARTVAVEVNGLLLNLQQSSYQSRRAAANVATSSRAAVDPESARKARVLRDCARTSSSDSAKGLRSTAALSAKAL